MGRTGRYAQVRPILFFPFVAFSSPCSASSAVKLFPSPKEPTDGTREPPRPGKRGLPICAPTHLLRATCITLADTLRRSSMRSSRARPTAISRMSRALEMFIVEGVYTTIPLHRKILADEDFRAGKIDTGFIERFLKKNGK